MLKRDFVRSVDFRQQVVDLLDVGDLTIATIARTLGVNRDHVERVQRTERLGWSSPMRPSSDPDLVAEVERLAAEGRDRQQIARALDINYRTVSAIAQRHGFDLATSRRERARQRATTVEDDPTWRQAFVEALQSGKSVKKVATAFGIDEHRAGALAKQLLPGYRSRFATREAGDRSRFFAYLDAGLSIGAAAVEVGIAPATAAAWARARRGAPRFTKSRVTDEQAERFVALVDAGETISGAAQRVGISRHCGNGIMRRQRGSSHAK